MEAVVGLMVMLLGVSHGIETYCDGRQNRSQCYGAVGGTVDVQLMDRALETFGYQWKKKNTTIIRWRNNMMITNLIENRSFFTPSNGTFRINNLSRNDGGEYILLTFDSNGKQLHSLNLQLHIQAPVSSVRLVSECLSEGQMKVSCSSEGDSPQYSWTLNGHTLTDAELFPGNNETNSIILKHVSGNLVCTVRNNVSCASNDTNTSTCGFIFINCTLSNGTHVSKWVFEANNTLCIPPTTTVTETTVGKKADITVTITPTSNITSPSPLAQWHIITLAGVSSALVILLVVGLAVICVHRKKKNNKAKEEENDQELTYADVRIMQRPERPVQQRTEVEVEYGQVKSSARPRQSVASTANDCMYATVRRDR